MLNFFAAQDARRLKGFNGVGLSLRIEFQFEDELEGLDIGSHGFYCLWRWQDRPVPRRTQRWLAT
jgi:hypothetical protein